MVTLIPPEILLQAYTQGVFPMADSKEGPVRWYTASPRGIIDLDAFHVPERLRRAFRKNPFTITVNRCFERVIAACADREETWISDEIIASYVGLHRLGFAHSVEAWRDEQLAGGLYGVSINAAFFGESMFHYITNASKAALVHLIERLKSRGFLLLDVQMVTPVMQQFGAVCVSRSEYLRRLKQALAASAEFV